MSKPIAVLISDIHFTVPTLDLATKSLETAIAHAQSLELPVVLCGDTVDGKAMLRGEVVNALLHILRPTTTPVHIIVGNHDLINEKSNDPAIEFLNLLPTVHLVDRQQYLNDHVSMIPYRNDLERLKEDLETAVKWNISTVIMHQGVQGANMGHYVQDTTSLPPEAFTGRRIISGHYHRRQDIELPDGGLFSYVGNPYTLTFGEALDPPKGYQILKEDGSLEFVPLNLRKHVIHESTTDNMPSKIQGLEPDDLLLLRISGPGSELRKLDKNAIGQTLLGHSNFRLDLNDTTSVKDSSAVWNPNKTDSEILDELIDKLMEEPPHKNQLKAEWRRLINETNKG